MATATFQLLRSASALDAAMALERSAAVRHGLSRIFAPAFDNQRRLPRARFALPRLPLAFRGAAHGLRVHLPAICCESARHSALLPPSGQRSCRFSAIARHSSSCCTSAGHLAGAGAVSPAVAKLIRPASKNNLANAEIMGFMPPHACERHQKREPPRA